MKVQVLKQCIINGKAHKPGEKEVDVSAKDGKVLVALGKVKDLTPVKEPLSLEMTVDVKELDEVKAIIADLQKEIDDRDVIIADLQKEIGSSKVAAKNAKGGAK